MNFDKDQILQNLEDVCRRLFPNGKKVGKHYQIGSVSGETGQSLKITVTGSSGNPRGSIRDFTTDERFDIISLWQQHNSFATPLEAFKNIYYQMGWGDPPGLMLEDSERDKSFPTLDALIKAAVNGVRQKFSDATLGGYWKFEGEEGIPLWEIRVNTGAEKPKKVFRLASKIENRFFMKLPLLSKRPLFNHSEIKKSDKIVVMCEGARKTDFAPKCFKPDKYIVTSCFHGALGRLEHTDFSPLNGKEVMVLADGDDTDPKKANDSAIKLKKFLLDAGARKVSIWYPPKTGKYDIADWIEETIPPTLEKFFEEWKCVEEDEEDLSEVEESFDWEVLHRLELEKKNGLPKHQWIISHVVPAGIGIVQAATNVGKTFISLSLAIHAAIGREFSGKPFKPLKTLIILGEDGKTSLSYRLAAITESFQFAYPAISDCRNFVPAIKPKWELLELDGRKWKITDAANKLLKSVKRHQFEFIVIDNLFSLGGADPNDAPAMRVLFKYLIALEEALKEANGHECVGVLLVHHFKKGQTSKFAEKGIEQGSGSSVIGNAPRFAFNLERVDNKKAKDELGITEAGKYVSLKLVKASDHPISATHVFKGTYVQEYNAFCYAFKKTVRIEHGEKETEELTEEILIAKLRELNITKPNAQSTLVRKLNAAKAGTQAEITDLLDEMLEKGILTKNAEGQILPLSETNNGYEPPQSHTFGYHDDL